MYKTTGLAEFPLSGTLHFDNTAVDKRSAN